VESGVRGYSDAVWFLVLCAVIAVILIAMRINAWSKTRPDPRFIVVNTPEGDQQVIQRPPAPARSDARATTQAQATAQARRGGQPEARTETEPRAQLQEQVPAQAEPTAPETPMQQAVGALSEVGTGRAVEPPEPPSPLDMLNPKIAQVPPQLAARVVELMNKRQEVSAVRLLCDELLIGILDAQKTARSLVGR
jgi:hypothetical protein